MIALRHSSAKLRNIKKPIASQRFAQTSPLFFFAEDKGGLAYRSYTFNYPETCAYPFN